MRGFLLFLGAMAGVYADGDLWVIEQDFVKFGKMEVYEASKKESLGKGVIATKEADSLRYIYWIPVGDYKGVQSFIGKRQGSLPYLSTLNFTWDSLNRYLSMCSFVPKGKESLAAYPSLHFYFFGIMPPNEKDFEDYLQNVANAQKSAEQPVCFRTWKVVLGMDAPKYVVVVYGNTEKEAEKLARGLELGSGEIKNILRSQKEGTCSLIPRDL